MKTPWTYELNGHKVILKGTTGGQGGGFFYMLQCSCGLYTMSEELYTADPSEETSMMIPEYREKYGREGWPKNKLYTYKAVIALLLAHVGYTQADADADAVKAKKVRAGWSDPECWDVAGGIIFNKDAGDLEAITALEETLTKWASILKESKEDIILGRERVEVFEGMKAGVNFDAAWHDFRSAV